MADDETVDLPYRPPPDRAEDSPSVAVVGAGAVGATAAADLASAGAEVRLFDRGEVAAGSTGRAAGIWYDAFAEDVDAAVADRALQRFRALAGAGEFAPTDCPYVWVACEGDDRRAEAIEAQVDRMRTNGREVSLLDPDGLAEQFPLLRTDDLVVGAVTRDAGHADPAAYARAMADRAREVGAEVHTGTEVRVGRDPLRVTGPVEYHPDAVVVAAGAHTKRLLADAGVPLAVKPYRVQALTASLDATYPRPIVFDATDGFYCRPHPAGLLAGDGTEEREADPDGYDRDADPESREGTLEGLSGRLRVDPSIERSWAGLCTATPDRDPLLGRVADGLYVATGFQGHGFMRAPALGEAIAGGVLAGDPAPIAPFDPRRFDGDEEFQVREGMVIEE